MNRKAETLDSSSLKMCSHYKIIPFQKKTEKNVSKQDTKMSVVLIVSKYRAM